MQKQLFTDAQLKNIERTIKVATNHEERGHSEKGLRWLMYCLGVQVFRDYHGAGLCADMKHPGLQQPRKLYDPESNRYVDERVLIERAMEKAASGELDMAMA